MMSRFCRYVEKVFDFGPRMERLKDSRRRPRIPLGAIGGAVSFSSLLCGSAAYMPWKGSCASLAEWND
jgi:hypothetical protein